MKFLSTIPAALMLALLLAAGAALAGAIAWGASRGGRPEPASQAQAATPTPAVEKTPGPPWDPARPDCPQGWRVYNDPDSHFSLCHPANLNEVTERRTIPDLGALLNLSEPVDPRRPSNAFAMTVSWSLRSSFVSGTPSAALCASQTGDTTNVTHSEFVQLGIANRTAAGCHWIGQRGPLRNAGQLRLDIPLTPDGGDSKGFVRVHIDYVGPDLASTFTRAQLIVATIRVP